MQEAPRPTADNDHGDSLDDLMTFDRHGFSVTVGTRVRVLEIAPSVKRDLPADERQELETMVGEVFEVYEIDGHGGAWVEKWWRDGDDVSHSHSLALAPHEMEVVSGVD